MSVNMSDIKTPNKNIGSNSEDSTGNNGKSPGNSKRKLENNSDKQNKEEMISIPLKMFKELIEQIDITKRSSNKSFEIVNKIKDDNCEIFERNISIVESSELNEPSTSVTHEYKNTPEKSSPENETVNKGIFEESLDLTDATDDSQTLVTSSEPVEDKDTHSSMVVTEPDPQEMRSSIRAMEVASKSADERYFDASPFNRPESNHTLGGPIASNFSNSNMESLHRKIFELENENINSKEEIELLKSTNIEWQKFHEQREVEFSQLQNQLLEVQQKLDTQASEFNPRQQEMVDKKFGEMRIAFDVQREELQNHIDELTVELQKKTEELKIFGERHAEQVSLLTHDNQELSAQIAELTSALVVASRSNSARNQKLEQCENEKKVLEETNRQLRHDNESQRSQLELNKVEIARLRQSRQASLSPYLRGPPSTSRKTPSPRATSEPLPQPSYSGAPPSGSGIGAPPGGSVMSRSFNFGSEDLARGPVSLGGQGFLRNHGNTGPHIVGPPRYHSNLPTAPPGSRHTSGPPSLSPASLPGLPWTRLSGPPSNESMSSSNQTFGSSSYHGNQPGGEKASSEQEFFDDIQTDFAMSVN